MSPRFPQTVRTGEVMKEQLAGAGIRVTLKQVEWGAALKNFVRTEYDGMSMIPLVWQPDPDAHVYDIFHSGSAINLGKFKDPRVDQLLEQGRTTLDRDKRIAIYRDLQRHMADQAYLVFPYASGATEALRDTVKDYVSIPGAQPRKPEPTLLQAGVARPLTVYVGKRLLLLIPTLLGVSVLTFLLIHLIPGDLVTILLGITASQNEQTRQALIHALHLDRPLAVQYLLWLGEVLRGDLGHSLVTGFSVRDELARSYPVTLQLALMAMSIALAVGVPLGVLAATRAGRALDASTRVFSLLFISAPAFFIGTVVIIAARATRRGCPPSATCRSPRARRGASSPCCPRRPRWAWPSRRIVARFTRSSMLEVLGAGLRPHRPRQGRGRRAVVYRHALRNALIPVVAMAGIQFVYLIGGAVIIEEVFALPGMGASSSTPSTSGTTR